MTAIHFNSERERKAYQDGLPPVPARAASTITAKAPTRVKTFADTGERSPRKLHVYTCRQWLPAHP